MTIYLAESLKKARVLRDADLLRAPETPVLLLTPARLECTRGLLRTQHSRVVASPRWYVGDREWSINNVLREVWKNIHQTGTWNQFLVAMLKHDTWTAERRGTTYSSGLFYDPFGAF